MSVFFAGRLIISPAVVSTVDDSGLANKNLTVGNNLALLGTCAGGQPNVPLAFGSPSQAQKALISGPLLDAVVKAFNPSNETGSPSQVIAVRVNPALQSALTLNDGSAQAAIALVATDYGLYTNQIKVKVEAGSTSGKKLTSQFGNNYYSQDNVSRAAFSLQYTGAQSTATIGVSNSTITLQAPTGSAVKTIDLATYPTIQQVVDVINSVAGFAASVLGGNGAVASLNGLDTVTGVDVKTSLYTVRADLQACIDWFNSTAEGYVTATRPVNAGLVPANIGFTYLAGGSDGVTTNTNWSNAYITLQTVDVQVVVPVSSSASIWTMNDAHCQFMSTAGRMERRGFVGEAVGCTDAQALTDALSLNSDRTSLVHIGYYDYDANGNWTLYPPYMTAALLGGMLASVDPGTPLTNKSINVRGLERLLRNPTDTDPLINGGVLCVEATPQGFKVVQSITTWLVNDNYNRVEVSTGVAVDYVARQVRDKLSPLRGQKGSPLLLSRALSITESTLIALARPEPQGPGIIVGDANNPAYKNITVSLDADVLRVQFEIHPAIGVNYVLVSIFATAFSGSVSA